MLSMKAIKHLGFVSKVLTDHLCFRVDRYVHVLNYQDENSAQTEANKAEVEATFANSEAVLAEQIRVHEGTIQKLEESICAERDTVQTHANRILDIQIDIQKVSSIVKHDEESLSVLERRVASTEANRRGERTRERLSMGAQSMQSPCSYERCYVMMVVGYLNHPHSG